MEPVGAYRERLRAAGEARMREGRAMLIRGENFVAAKTFWLAEQNFDKRTEPAAWAESIVMQLECFEPSAFARLRPGRSVQELEELVKILEKNGRGLDATLATPLKWLAYLAAGKRNFANAARIIDRALKIEEEQHGTGCGHIAAILRIQALIVENTAGTPQACESTERILQRALRIDRERLGPLHCSVVDDLEALSGFYERRHDTRNAQGIEDQLVTLSQCAYPDMQPDAKAAHNRLLAILLRRTSEYERTGQSSKLEHVLQLALTEAERTWGVEDHRLDEHLLLLAAFYRKQDRIGDAAVLYERLLNIHEVNHTNDEAGLKSALRTVADFDVECGRLDDAARQLDRLLSISERTDENEDPVLNQLLRRLSDSYQKAGDLVAAEKVSRRRLGIMLGKSTAEIREFYRASGRISTWLPSAFRGLLTTLTRLQDRAAESEITAYRAILAELGWSETRIRERVKSIFLDADPVGTLAEPSSRGSVKDR